MPGATRAAHGSAAKIPCESCGKGISKTNFSKHKKKCKGQTERLSRSEIRKRRTARSVSELSAVSALLVNSKSCKPMLDTDTNTQFGVRVRLQKYRNYMQTAYQTSVKRWVEEDVRRQNAAPKVPVQDQINAFGEANDYKTLAELKVFT
ncbi:hypothetical protein PHYPSEUDO_010307 [Phytophthora pseudosyringae]|uniref:Uncharacterized protein n=1 Tax=Phytophthora pseudosyringae TaxID=221518 RepID=A0A8T1VDE9_9STRA|nr:hypothetical protein PHYPSEUDO_010307 [Phytophthora pseudosyringae]